MKQHAADFYRRQTHPETTPPTDTLTVAGTCPPQKVSFDASLATVLRTLIQLSTAPDAHPRGRRHRIDARTNYVADTVTRHYTRHPSVELRTVCCAAWVGGASSAACSPDGLVPAGERSNCYFLRGQLRPIAHRLAACWAAAPRPPGPSGPL
ncbi:hypothetical protein ABZ904_43010 [Streptomyces sp. NPDC046900]|uniref:hypothetical protein n=1 Tax=Streptomyces sp. NPDC046900 TaxID=3155473 RepID=UPI0033C3F6FF